MSQVELSLPSQIRVWIESPSYAVSQGGGVHAQGVGRCAPNSVIDFSGYQATPIKKEVALDAKRCKSTNVEVQRTCTALSVVIMAMLARLQLAHARYLTYFHGPREENKFINRHTFKVGPGDWRT